MTSPTRRPTIRQRRYHDRGPRGFDRSDGQSDGQQRWRGHYSERRGWRALPIVAGPIDFATALANAATAGGYLATIRSAVENAAVQAVLGARFAWIGASDAAVGRRLAVGERPGGRHPVLVGRRRRVASGRRVRIWGGGEPNNQATKTRPACRPTGVWNDATGSQAGPTCWNFPGADLDGQRGGDDQRRGGGCDAASGQRRDRRCRRGHYHGQRRRSDHGGPGREHLSGTNANGTIQMEGDITAGTAATCDVSLADCNGWRVD